MSAHGVDHDVEEQVEVLSALWNTGSSRYMPSVAWRTMGPSRLYQKVSACPDGHDCEIAGAVSAKVLEDVDVVWWDIPWAWRQVHGYVLTWNGLKTRSEESRGHEQRVALADVASIWIDHATKTQGWSW